MRAGVKTNVIPDAVELEVDIRTLPGQTGAEIEAMIREAVGDLSESVEISALSDDPSSESAIDTPLWDSIQRVTGALVPGSRTVPFMIVGATDARFFRRAGSVAYGAGLFSDRIPFAEFMSMFHGNDERIDQESLRLSAEFWMGVAKDFLG
jgi:acetylornithine deacetylase/succinyl-diaminopimelate desuccinylase-like protein